MLNESSNCIKNVFFFFKPGSVDSVLDSLGSGLGLALNSTKVV